MKKIILLLGMFLAANTMAMAACDYECVAPYNMNTRFRTFMSSASGINMITEKKFESVLKKEVLKIASADELDVDLESYSPRDLKNGIFKSIHVKGQNVLINDINLASLDLKTLCDFNYIKLSGEDVVFMEQFPMSLDVEMTQSSINKTMEHEKYQKVVKDLNKLANSYAGGLQIASTKVAIKSSKFYYIVGFNIPFVPNVQKIVLQSDLNVKNGKIDFTNTKMVSGHFKLDLKKLDFILNYLNPLDFSVNILKNKDAKVTISDVYIQNDIVFAKGVVVIPKD